MQREKHNDSGSKEERKDRNADMVVGEKAPVAGNLGGGRCIDDPGHEVGG